MRTTTTAAKARELIHQASRNLGLPSPLEEMGDVLDQSLAFPLGERYGSANPLSPSFAETAPENLSFLVSPDGPRVTPSDRVEASTRALRQAGRSFGPGALKWLDGKIESVTGPSYLHSASYGASFGSSIDRNGVSESFAQYEWGPMLMDALPAPLYRITRVALETLPGLRPAYSTIRCGRTSGSQQVSFEMERALPLTALQPLMNALGLGARHAGLMSAIGFILGARFTLPPHTAMLTLRPSQAGVELRIDVDLDSLPDPPAQLMALMRLQMTERPKSIQGLDRWLMALTPDGLPGPGTVSVLSVWVRPDLPARLALYLRPAFLASEAAPDKVAAPVRPPASQGLADDYDQAQWASSAWA